MLRESSVVYSSLPQEEGGTNNNNNNNNSGGGTRPLTTTGAFSSSGGSPFITTRPKTPHSRRDCQLTSLIIALVIICGVTLAVVLPLALQHTTNTEASGLRDGGGDEGSLAAFLNSGQSSVVDAEENNNNKDGTTGDEITTKKVDIPEETPDEFTGSDNKGQQDTPNDSGDGSSGQDGDTSSETDPSVDSILDEIYGKDDQYVVKPNPTQSFGGWVNELMSQHDQTTLVVLIVLVAVAAAMVVTAVAWLIHTRLTSRRRRINIQSVITDLQSRDKVVLLNSEDSEEE
ncbi:hypothetical protein Pmani_038167 [Petrolisthes manimaculis]|uniref:Uncharacterized protein n=1 Tax=Petrolisthes manimaculis TaxID=1843537 RepID=A0AAE1TML4_9EUCA|nr:hypothetical protein Pmani_038167 [Petrolisthes manimaculis]